MSDSDSDSVYADDGESTTGYDESDESEGYDESDESAAGPEWPCSKCTFINSYSSSKCKMCHAEPGDDVNELKSATNAGVEDSEESTLQRKDQTKAEELKVGDRIQAFWNNGTKKYPAQISVVNPDGSYGANI